MIKTIVGRKIAGKVARKLDLRMVGLGLAAYAGLHVLNRFGVLPAQTGAALRAIDRAVDAAGEFFGLEDRVPTRLRRGA